MAKQVTKTVEITVTYTEFEVGEMVWPIDGILQPQVYTVKRFYHPDLSTGDFSGGVFLEEVDWEHDAAYFRLATEQEIENELI